jgi:hypothetical protein
MVALAAPPRMAAPPQETRKFFETSHDLAQWMIQLADTKASILLAASAVLAGLLGQQALQPCVGQGKWVLYGAIIFAIATAFTCLLDLYPRTKPQEHSSLLYYRAIVKFQSASEYAAKVESSSSADLDHELAQQIFELAPTLQKKYHYLGWAVVLFGVCLVVTLIALGWARFSCP